MRVFYDIDHLPRISSPVLTIGTFDGVHIGHQKIIQQLNKEAEKIGGESVLFTFFPHPRMVLFPEDNGLKLLQTQQEKLQKLEKFGLQNVIVIPFTFEFSRLTALEFVRDFLVNKLNIKKLVIGYDHQFGKNREGTIEYLKDVSSTYAFDVIEIPAQEIDEINVSSTKIRTAIKEGNVELANSYLGEPYELSGIVVHGNALGRTIGFPTANLDPVDSFKLLPANGVYAVKVLYAEKEYIGMMNIGFRPTMNFSDRPNLEVHILDFDKDIYGEKITVLFLSKIREEKKFSGVDQLIEQLREDENSIRTDIHTGRLL